MLHASAEGLFCKTLNVMKPNRNFVLLISPEGIPLEICALQCIDETISTISRAHARIHLICMLQAARISGIGSSKKRASALVCTVAWSTLVSLLNFEQSPRAWSQVDWQSPLGLLVGMRQ